MQIDARGPRFGAAITLVVLVLVIILDSPILLAFQTLVWAIGAIAGPHRSPYGFIFKTLVKPRLKKAGELENVKPPQFAMLVGFIFGAVGLIGAAIGSPTLFFVATSFALSAAFLNAVFNFCLGCEMYLLLVRARLVR
jgi:branched-subunit amino acid transport protein AzlD